jgi:hypothetical protein
MLNKVTLSVTAAMAMTATAWSGNLIINGTFETGNTSGWTAVSSPFFNTTGSCNNGFAAQTTATGCRSGTNPVSGSYAAYTSASFPTINNDVGEWDNYLRQTFVVPAGITSAILTWQDSSAYTGTGTFRGVDYEAALKIGSTYLGGQFSLTNPGGNGFQPWTTEAWDVTSILQANVGQTLTLEMAAFVFFDSRGGSGSYGTAANIGFDNIALNATASSPTPEPEMMGLTGAALVALGVRFRRTRRAGCKHGG